MENYLISEAIGDIAGSAYEGRMHCIKDYDKVKMFSSRAHFTDDTVLTFACAGTVGPAMICFLESKDYVDCIKLAISLGGDADTLAAIAGPMAYAYYKKMPDALVYQAMKKLPEWMVEVSERFDEVVNHKIEEGV